MRFLADESCDGAIVHALRLAGHDVLAISEFIAGAPDTEVIRIAVTDSRVLVTEDKDFGQLVYASGHGHNGVILLRYPFPLAATMADVLVRLLIERGDSLHTSFVVLQPGKSRIHRPPEA